MVNKGSVRKNVPADITDIPIKYWMGSVSAIRGSLAKGNGRVMDTRLLMAQNHDVVQYLIPRQRVNLALDCPALRRRHVRRSASATK